MINKDLTNFILNFLDSGIPSNYYFHNRHHTHYVYEKATEIALKENCSGQEIRLIQAAALLHDTGYTVKYQHHEEESCNLAREFLPRFSYSTEEIDTICSLIMATRIPQTPTGILEEILADADLEYLGTNLAAEEADKLFKELASLNPALTPATWDEMQLKFISNHAYFTDFCRTCREPKKQQYLTEIKNRMQASA